MSDFSLHKPTTALTSLSADSRECSVLGIDDTIGAVDSSSVLSLIRLLVRQYSMGPPINYFGGPSRENNYQVPASRYAA